MLETVAAAPPDPILGLAEAFQKDPRPGKANLTIGVYCDEQGKTPVLDSVKQAERWLVDNETTKKYLGIDGLPDFLRHAIELTFGGAVPADRVAAFQTPGGTGGLRVAADFLASNFPGARVWMSNPTWPNHPAIFQAAGLATEVYPYLTADRTHVDFASVVDTLERLGKAGDILCLHACCHNPTGADFSPEQWEELAELSAQRGMLPLVDFAYLGFGDGPEADRRGLLAMLRQHEEMLVCTSFSKNFGLYSERVGALMILAAASETADIVRSNVKRLIRANYSNPPRHGAAIVATILADADLRRLWESELAAMRERIHQVRRQLVERLRQLGAPRDFSFLLDQRGMFSYSGLSPMQVDWLRSEKGIYIVGSGRINVAGLTPENLDSVARAICEALTV
ncbi:MAG: aspartate/tyrosine/aromatic aminotransferase [Planctomycetota bacterium]|nr:MAG: aspartate/tyrosine/aromatic aminotransferase [Planctomycetota bacterium]